MRFLDFSLCLVCSTLVCAWPCLRAQNKTKSAVVDSKSTEASKVAALELFCSIVVHRSTASASVILTAMLAKAKMRTTIPKMRRLRLSQNLKHPTPRVMYAAISVFNLTKFIVRDQVAVRAELSLIIPSKTCPPLLLVHRLLCFAFFYTLFLCHRQLWRRSFGS